MTEEKSDVASDFELMDREDEEQILQELRGVPVDKFIYKNSRGQYELSYAGTKWAVREMANRGEAIRIDGHPKIERCVIDPEFITVTILAKRVKVDREARAETLLDTTLGSARGWIKQKLIDGRIIPDEHFFTKTVSKATRNVQQSLMPQDFKKEIIEALKVMQGGGAAPAKGRGAAPGKPQAQKPPAAPPQKPAAAPAPSAAAPAQAPAAEAAPTPAPAPAKPAAAPAQKPAAAPAQKPVAQKPAAAPAAAPKPAAAPAPAPKPAAAPAAAAKPPVANTTKSAAAQTPREAGMDVLFQRFEVVLKQASRATDRPMMLAFLKQITGKDAVTALTREEITELGPILNSLSKGAYQYAEGAIRDIVTGEIIWPKQAEQFEPAPEPQVEEAPAEGAAEPLF